MNEEEKKRLKLSIKIKKPKIILPHSLKPESTPVPDTDSPSSPPSPDPSPKPESTPVPIPDSPISPPPSSSLKSESNVNEIVKPKKEQERKRQLWDEQQKARLKNNLPEDRNIAKGQDRLGTESDQEKAEKELGQDPQDKTLRANLARLRLRDSQNRETDSKQKETLDDQGQETAKVDETTKSLKNIYRVINGASAITFFGLIITFFTMNLQLLAGNLLGSKMVPKLSFFEIIVIIFLDLLFIFTTLLLVVLIYAIANPCDVAEYMPEWGAVASVMGKVCTAVGKTVGFVKGLF